MERERDEEIEASLVGLLESLAEAEANRRWLVVVV